MWLQITFRAVGSSPRVGSSRRRTLGLCRRHLASSRRLFIPPEYLDVGIWAQSPSPTNLIIASIRWALSTRGMSYSAAWISRFSHPVSFSSRLTSWKRIPISLFTRSDCRDTSWPFIETFPEVGFNRDDSIRMRVVFPAPLGPKKPKVSPSPIFRLTPSTANVSL